MDFSVIIPVYNQELYLEECLHSVLDQQYAGTFEVIAVNDESTDRSGEILAAMAADDPRLKVVDVKHGAQATARNVGLEHAAGKWVVFVDSDDRLLPGALETFASMARKTQADIVVGGVVRDMALVSQTGCAQYSLIPSRSAVLATLYQKPGEYMGSVWGKCFRRTLFNSIRFRDGYFYEDTEIMPRLFHEAATIAVADINVYYYRRNPQSFISTWSDGRAHVLEVLDMLAREPFIRDDAELGKALNNRKMSAAFNLLLLMDNLKVRKAGLRHRCVKLIRSYRTEVMLDGRSRAKNRIGAALAHLGMPVVIAFNRVFGIVK